MNKIAEIILVEDDPSDAELIIRALKKRSTSIEILHLKNGAECLEHLFGHGQLLDKGVAHFPKLLLMDLKLPKVNGFDVLKKIKSNSQTKCIPVVIFTSSNEIKDIKMCYELGANSYIVKPLDFEIFLDTVSTIEYYWIDINSTF